MPPTLQPAALAELVDRHAEFLFRVAHSLLGNRQDAEDAVQDTFMKLLRTNALAQPAWQEVADERAYLARAVWRSGIDRLATEQSRALRQADDLADHPLPSLAPTPEQQALAAADRALLHRLLAALPAELRQPLLLSAIDDMRGAEVALTLGIPEATVRTRILRAKAELRRRFLALTATQTGNHAATQQGARP